MDIITLLWVVGISAFLGGLLISLLVDWLFWRRKLRLANERNYQAESMMREQVEEVEHMRYQIAKFNESFDEYDRYTKKLEYDLESSRLELGQMRVQHEASDARARQFQADVTNMRRQVQQGQGDGDAAQQLNRYKRALYDSVNENKRLAVQLREQETKLTQIRASDDALLSLNGEGEVYKSLEPVSLMDGGDRLEKINGIGNVYADRLRAAGIRTFADLSRMRSERLTDIIQPKKWQQIEPDRWIAEAAELMRLGGSEGELR